MATPVVGFGPIDHFSADVEFHEQDSSKTVNETSAMILDASGNEEAETTGLDTRNDFEDAYDYDGTGTDLKTALGTLLSQFGDVHNSVKMDELGLHFEAGQYAKMTLTGHNHVENAHVATTDGYSDVSGVLPGGTVFGVPTLAGQVNGDNASPISMDLTFRGTHIDRVGSDGNHFAGRTITFMAELSCTFLGIPTTALPTSWTMDTESDSTNPNESNTNFDEYVITAHQYFVGVFA